MTVCFWDRAMWDTLIKKKRSGGYKYMMCANAVTNYDILINTKKAIILRITLKFWSNKINTHQRQRHGLEDAIDWSCTIDERYSFVINSRVTFFTHISCEIYTICVKITNLSTAKFLLNFTQSPCEFSNPRFVWNLGISRVYYRFCELFSLNNIN
jgi:hypothetical protein